MLIANPIYDAAFKALLLEKRAAKFLIGTLLNETVIDVEPAAQEFVEQDKDTHKLLLFRMDFQAVIRTPNGRERRVLIEMQKARMMSDILPRFRKYLGHHYVSDERALPITTIYVLGFTLPGIETACCRIGREYYDLVEQRPIAAHHPFVDQLTHDCYVVQAPLISQRFLTPLDRLLNLFEQANFDQCYDGTKKAYKDFTCDPATLDPDLKFMVDKLTYIAATPKYRKQLDKEMYYEEYIRNTFGPKDAEIAEKTRLLAEKNQMLEEKDSMLEKKDSMLAEKDSMLEKKDSMIAEKENVIAEKENVIAEKENVIVEKENVIAEKEKALAKEREARAKQQAENEALRRELAKLRKGTGSPKSA